MDDDDDGIPDAEEDTDGDGIPDYMDDDVDGDGIADDQQEGKEKHKVRKSIMCFFDLVLSWCLGVQIFSANVINSTSNKQITSTIETRHSHRHSPQSLIHVTTKAKVILALLCQKSYPLSRGQHALDDPKIMKEHTNSFL